MMEEPQKPFACNLPDCGMSFTNEDHLHVHTKKHDMVLQLGMEQKAAFVADQTPTPTRFIRNCEEVGLFQDLQNVTENPFDEGFKKAMEAKHGIMSLESVIAASTSDDVLHTPQMYPLIDAGDSALFTSSNHRNVTISRSSSDETGTVNETTTISKLTNEVTTISRIIGHRDILDKTADDSTKTNDIIKDINETVFTNNVVKVQFRKDAKEYSVPVVVYTDTFKNQNVVNDVLLNETNTLKVPEKFPPIMSQKSLEVLVDSLTSELASDVNKNSNTNTDSSTKPNTKCKTKYRKLTSALKTDSFKKGVPKFRLAPKITEKVESFTKHGKELADNDFEVIIKMPNGKQMRMKTVEDIETKELLRKSLTKRGVESVTRAKNTALKKIPAILKNTAPKEVSMLQNVTLNAPVMQNIIQIPTGTLIPVTLVNQCGNVIPAIPNLDQNRLQTNDIETFIKNTPKVDSSVLKPSIPNLAPTMRSNDVTLTPTVELSNNIINHNAKVDKSQPVIITRISNPDPFSAVKISQPYELDNTGKKTDEKNLVYITANDINQRIREAENQDDDCIMENVSNNAEAVKRTRLELESRSAASKRYRERFKEQMLKQARENKQLKEMNQKLIAEKAMLKLLITEHMKRCPNADDLRTTQEKLKNQVP